jgi:predicted N-formylglutamate amidohydrolase
VPGFHPPPVTVLNEQGRSPFVLICEHASNWLPPDCAGLGLPTPDLSRHIAWDIGALDVARHASELLDSALVVAGASRLLIDLNRPKASATSIPEMSEATLIPGNLNLSPAERQRRITSWFDPFQSRVAHLLDQRQAAQRPTVVVAVHSFTPVFLGKPRNMQAGVLYRRSQRFGAALVEALGGAASAITHNQPYQIEEESDYTVPIHGEARGLDAVLVEIRQDLIANTEGAAKWGARLSSALLDCDPTA